MEPEQGVKGMHLVGRERELAEISATWQRSTAGEPSVVVLAGESGVGKTSLVRALLDLEGPSAVPAALHSLVIGKALDRIADHSAIIGSRLRYLLTGDPGHLAAEIR